MPTLTVYDPALCCSTGVCGPSVDPALVQIASDLEWLKQQGVPVQRHNLSQEPAKFAANPHVQQILQRTGTAALPLVFLDDELIASRFYPGKTQLAKVLGLSLTANDCGCGSTGCCG